jgi:hypothetical protein
VAAALKKFQRFSENSATITSTALFFLPFADKSDQPFSQKYDRKTVKSFTFE